MSEIPPTTNFFYYGVAFVLRVGGKSFGAVIIIPTAVIGASIDTIPNIGIGNANVNGNNPRFAYP